MTNELKNKPVAIFREGALKATLWRNWTLDGPLYKVALSRSYKRADGSFAESNSFSAIELKKLMILANEAIDRIRIEEAADHDSAIMRNAAAASAS